MNTEQNCHHDLLPGHDPLPPVREENCDTESWWPSVVSSERETIRRVQTRRSIKSGSWAELGGNWVGNYLTMFDWGYLRLVPASCHPDIGDIHPKASEWHKNQTPSSLTSCIKYQLHKMKKSFLWKRVLILTIDGADYNKIYERNYFVWNTKNRMKRFITNLKYCI